MVSINQLVSQRGIQTDRGGQPSITVDTSQERALQQVGSQIQRAGEAVSAQYAQQASFQAEADWQNFKSAEALRLQEQAQNVEPGAVGFAASQAQEYNTRSAEFLKSLPGPLQEKYTAKVNAYRGTFNSTAATTEYTERSRYQKQEIGKVTEGLLTIAQQNPDNVDQVVTEGNELIDESNLTPVEKDIQRSAWNVKAREASWYGLLERDPVAARKALGFTAEDETVEIPGSAGDLIRAKEGFRTNAYWDVNAWRTGYGSDTVTRADGTVVRVTKDTVVTREDAERDLARRLKEFESVAVGNVGMDAWAALPEQARTALISVTYNYGEIPNRIRGAVQSGDLEKIATAVEGLKTDNQGVNSARRQEEADIIRGQRTVRRSTAPDEKYADIPLNRRMQLANAAESQISKNMTAARADLQASIQNQAAAIAAAGVSPTPLHTEEQFKAAYGDDRGQVEFENYQSGMAVADQAFRVKGMPLDQQNAMIDQQERVVQEAATGEGENADAVAREARELEILRQAVTADQKAWRQDPAKMAIETTPGLQDILASLNQNQPGQSRQQVLSAYIDAISEVQTRKGIPLNRQVLVPVQNAKDAVERLTDESLPPNERMDGAAALIVSTNNPAHQQVIFQQLVREGMPSSYAGVFGALNRGDEAAYAGLTKDAVFDRRKVPIESDLNTQIKEAYTAVFNNEDALGGIMYGLGIGDDSKLQRQANDSELVLNGITRRVMAGQDVTDAAEAVAADLFGDLQVISGQLGNARSPEGVEAPTIQPGPFGGGVPAAGLPGNFSQPFNFNTAIPTDQDPEKFVDGVNNSAATFREALEQTVADGFVTAFAEREAAGENVSGERARLDVIVRNRVDDIMRNGVIREVNGEYALFDTYSGGYVIGRDGEIVSLSMDEINRAAQ